MNFGCMFAATNPIYLFIFFRDYLQNCWMHSNNVFWAICNYHVRMKALFYMWRTIMATILAFSTIFQGHLNFQTIFLYLSSKTFQDKICNKTAFIPSSKRVKLKSWQVEGSVDLFWDMGRNNQATEAKPVGSAKGLCTDFYNKVCQNVRTYQ